MAICGAPYLKGSLPSASNCFLSLSRITAGSTHFGEDGAGGGTTTPLSLPPNPDDTDDDADTVFFVGVQDIIDDSREVNDIG